MKSLFTDRASVVLQCFQQGLSRTGLVGHEGFMELNWDTHAVNFIQSDHYQDLFGGLSSIMEELHARPGTVHPTLADETVVVVLSEMGRYPQLNSRQGKDHWTFTSAMIIGAGVEGGQAVGGYTDTAAGERVDVASGQIHEKGEKLVPDHIGATLLALADIDPAEHVDAAPLASILAGG